MHNSKQATQALANTYADCGDPDGWFEEFYARADGDIRNIYWADLKPNPLLFDWIDTHPFPDGSSAVVVGCGLGDDAEALDRSGFQVTAFDISPSAIEMCRHRFPGSRVRYMVADLFQPPAEYRQSFDLVFECNTIQILTGANRNRALLAIVDLVGPGGQVVVSCRSRNHEEGWDQFPVALDRAEIDGFVHAGLQETHFHAYDDDQDPPVPHYFAVYTRAPDLS